MNELKEIFQVMTNLQELIAEQVLERVTDDDIENLSKLHTQMTAAAESGNRDEYFVLNQRVHRELTRLAGNHVLAKLEEQLGIKIARARYMANMNPDRWLESVDEHGQIMDALQRRDRSRLVFAMREHMKNTGKAVVTGLIHVTS
ncbi:FCD domain-containing protein [Paenalcaligenes niemegkensis]|uniref:GntR family transcriptional regulator n=1 Tax=Paenalcaligenes niemegkensis TaxID=2895469 RepID=UPI001EE8B442|nr:FCD domain-containing protein [Paenalcaligenes niemegkensis]MCQ9617899.1 FCD domain-containing protein [Paenalcaligenes niemegkensis]